MRLLNEDTDSAFSRLTLLLTKAEASELRDSLEAILNSDAVARHEHVPSEDFQKEVTISIYDESDISRFHERAQELIRADK